MCLSVQAYTHILGSPTNSKEGGGGGGQGPIKQDGLWG